MLRSTGYRDLKVIDIAREAGTSPATFYQYFPDVEAAILVLAEQMARDGHRLSTLIREGSWRGKRGVGPATSVWGAVPQVLGEEPAVPRGVGPPAGGRGRRLPPNPPPPLY